MASRLDEKHQKIIRALLQEPGNKKCADCGAKGPVYANVTHYTFICTACSGIHREFNHRVKSVSMASFKPEEVKGLQEGGNEVHKGIWLARWNPEEYPEPTQGDDQSIRRFLRMKYIDKKWYKAPAETKRREPDEPKAEPLSNILGNDIPPIKVNQTANEAKIAQFPAFDNTPQKQPDLFAAQTFSGKPQTSPESDFNPFAGASTPVQPTPQSSNGMDLFSLQVKPQPTQPTPTPVQPDPLQAQPAKKPIDLSSLYQQQAIQNQMKIQSQMGLGGQPGVGVQPGLMQPGMMQPGMMQPGMMQPGMGGMQPGMGGMQPGYGQPGMMQPGYGQPGMMQPGMGGMQPGMMQPGMMQPGMGGMQPGYGQPGMMQPGVGGMQPGYGQPYGVQPGYGTPTPIPNPTPTPEPAKPDPFASLLEISKTAPAQKPVQTTAQPTAKNDWPF
jgi:hypothetical protein